MCPDGLDLVGRDVVEPQRTVDAISGALPDGVVVVGGGSAWHSLGSGGPSWQFCDDRVTSEGVAVLLFSGPVASSVAVGTGWRSLGASGVVTRSASGRVDEIDGRPAVEFLARYLDVSAPASYGNPLAVREVGTTESYLRGIAGSDLESGALNVFGSVPIGSMVQLTTTTTEGILEGTRESIAAAAAGFPAGTRPEAALVFSCVARRMLLGSRAGAEVDLARSELGPTVPLAGLYCYGEIGPVSGSPSSRYFNTTFVTLLLGT